MLQRILLKVWLRCIVASSLQGNKGARIDDVLYLLLRMLCLKERFVK
jgi:hypothetical protein